MAKEIGLVEALKATASIMQAIKGTEDGQDRKNIKLASRKLKQLKKQLKREGWEDWEKIIYNDLVKAYANQLKKLMSK